MDKTFSNTLLHDDTCLENMRKIIKEYIAYRQNHPAAADQEQRAFHQRYEEIRQKMRDDALKAFTAFELMEKLYWQEYLSTG